MYDYEEACPISKAASTLCERWTLQIIREMFFGATRFSDFQKYLPKISPALLNSRLRQLEDQGIIIRKRITGKKGYEYQLTPSGKALKPVLASLGKWSVQWMLDWMDPEQLNLSTIIRDYAVSLRMDELPSGDSTIQFTITGHNEPIKKYVLVRDGATQICEEDMGYDVDVYLTAELETFGKLWFGQLGLQTALEKGLLKAVGPPVYTKRLSRWLGVSQFASVVTENDQRIHSSS